MTDDERCPVCGQTKEDLKRWEPREYDQGWWGKSNIYVLGHIPESAGPLPDGPFIMSTETMSCGHRKTAVREYEEHEYGGKLVAYLADQENIILNVGGVDLLSELNYWNGRRVEIKVTVFK